MQLDPLTTEFDAPETRSSYASVEACPHAQAEVDRLVEAGFVTRCPTLHDLEHVIGPGTKVVSKFGQVIKEKSGEVKRRLILDARESGVTVCARKNQRIVLPSMNDLVFDALDLLATKQECEHFILDIKDAFWTLPLVREERRFFIGRLKGVFYAFRRLAQGSRGAPLAWCRFFALIARLTQALFQSTEARFNVYVDDPAAILAGTRANRDMATAATVLVWRLLNLQLQFRKGQRGDTVDWIGFRSALRSGLAQQAVVVSVRPETQKELIGMIEDFCGRNLLTVKEVRKLAGKLSNVARLLLAWRPFLFEVWAAMSAAGRANSRRIWTRQIRPALTWYRAFLQDEAAGICRTFRLAAYLQPSDCVSITVDASPFGMGAHLCRNGAPLEFFAIPLAAEDLDIFGYAIGDSAGQQTWECLVALIALRVWQAHWSEDRTALVVKGDNVSLLTMVEDLKTTGPGTSIVGRELALVIAGACYKPRTATHVPGVANVVADQLSRRHDPEYAASWRRHDWLEGALEITPPPRPRSWYRTMTSAAVPLRAAKGVKRRQRTRRSHKAKRPRATPT